MNAHERQNILFRHNRRTVDRLLAAHARPSEGRSLITQFS